MTGLLLAILAILATWLLTLVPVIGVGAAVRGAVGGDRDADAATGFTSSFWLGVAATLGLLQLWSFLRPVDGLAAGLIGVVGLAGLVWQRREVLAWLRPLLARRGLLLAWLVAGLWLADRAAGAGDATDSGLYHYAAVAWASHFPVVPGLANLSVAQAMNNSSFLWSALFDLGPWRGRYEHVCNGVLLWAFFLPILSGLAALLRRDGRPARPDVFRATLLVPAVMLAVSKDVSSPKTDLPAGLLTLAVADAVAGFLLRRDKPTRDAAAIAVLCAACVTVKLSTAVFCLGVAAVVIVAWRRGRDAGDRPARPLAAAALACVLLVGGWAGRNVVQSGYPLFPGTVLAMPVSWRVPPEKPRALVRAIEVQPKGEMALWMSGVLERTPLRFYGRLMRPPFDDRFDARGLNWVASWLLLVPAAYPTEVVLPALLALTAALACFLRRRETKWSALWWLALPFGLALAFWMWAGPDGRYAWPFFWALAAAGAAAAFAEAARRPRAWLAAILLLALVPLGYKAATLAFLRRQNPLAEVPFIPPGPDGGLTPRPQMALKLVPTAGAAVWVPAEDVLVWQPVLPSSGWPKLDPRLALREPGNLAAGFELRASP